MKNEKQENGKQFSFVLNLKPTKKIEKEDKRHGTKGRKCPRKHGGKTVLQRLELLGLLTNENRIYNNPLNPKQDFKVLLSLIQERKGSYLRTKERLHFKLNPRGWNKEDADNNEKEFYSNFLLGLTKGELFWIKNRAALFHTTINNFIRAMLFDYSLIETNSRSTYQYGSEKPKDYIKKNSVILQDINGRFI